MLPNCNNKKSVDTNFFLVVVVHHHMIACPQIKWCECFFLPKINLTAFAKKINLTGPCTLILDWAECFGARNGGGHWSVEHLLAHTANYI
jgi:hypothetical protein